MKTNLFISLFVLCFAWFSPQATAQQFQQGPEQMGATVYLQGRVIAIHGQCALVLADTARPGWEGMGGGGRFFYCAPDMKIDQEVSGKGVQTDTRFARVGPRWRVLPVYSSRAPGK